MSDVVLKKRTLTRHKIRINPENEEEFMKSALGRLLKLIFNSNVERTHLAYQILLMLRNERQGIVVRGSQSRIMKRLNVHPPSFHSIVNKLIEVGLVEKVPMYSPVIQVKKIKGENEILTEKKRNALYMRLAENTYFSNMMSDSVLVWVNFRKHPEFLKLTEEEKIHE